MAAFATQCRRRYPRCFYSGCLWLLLLLLVLVLMFLHFKLLPAVTGGYNQECYLTSEQLNDFRYAIKTIAKTMDKYNVSYWLDYGTLLGVMKFGDIIPWDHDADISFVLNTDSGKFHDEVTNLGVKSNPLQARYMGLSIDYMRWVPKNGIFDGKEVILLNKYYPDRIWKNDNLVVRYQHKLESFPVSWAVPSKKIKFLGVAVSIPNSPELLLSHRYPYSYWLNVNVPYKWKCWVPCFLRHSQWCNSRVQ